MTMRNIIITVAAFAAFLLLLAPFNQTWYAPLTWGLGAAALIALYWAPSIIAVTRHVRAPGQIIVINTFFAWTGIGWVIALAMAFRTRHAYR